MELQAFKPGNVSIHSPGHGMTAEDFLRSAEVSADALSQVGSSVGARVLAAVRATSEAVGCNTNLGIVLLCAPLALAAQMDVPESNLRARLQQVLVQLDVSDGEEVFEAIRIARPAGLGQVRRHDVSGPCEVSLLEAMRSARGADRIADQYVSAYEDVFGIAVEALRQQLARKDGLAGMAWATVASYLAILARLPDTHIVRKFGATVAEDVQLQAAGVESTFKACENSEAAARLLITFDKKLKREGINPGTSADLTVAGLLVYYLQNPSVQ